MLIVTPEDGLPQAEDANTDELPVLAAVGEETTPDGEEVGVTLTEADSAPDGVPAEQTVYTLVLNQTMTRRELGLAMAEWVDDTRWLLDNLVADNVPAAVLVCDVPEALYTHIRAALTDGLSSYTSVVSAAMQDVREGAKKAGIGMRMPTSRGNFQGPLSYEDTIWENLLSVAALTVTIDAMSNNADDKNGGILIPFPEAGGI